MNDEYCEYELDVAKVLEAESSVMEEVERYGIPTPLEGYPVRQFKEPVKRYCQIMEITDCPELIAKYRECHAAGHAWREVLEGIRSVGILEMELYIFGNKVIMIVETPLDFEWHSAMEKLTTLPRQAEWESFVAVMQGCDPSATSDQKWQLMERMFYLYD